MKKYLFISIMLLSSIQMLAQRTNLRFTVFVDPKFSWMSSDVKSVESDGSKLGVNIGLNVDNFFADNYAVMSGVSINNVGGKLTFGEFERIKTNGGDTMLTPGSTMEYKLQYINIPLGLKLKTNEIGYWTFFTHLGINSGINIKATGEVDNIDLDNQNISKEVALFNLGYYIGAGVEYSIGGKSAIVVGLTYTNGFIDITDGNDKVTLSNLAVRLGILF